MRSPLRVVAAVSAALVASVSVGGALGLWPVHAPATAHPETTAQSEPAQSEPAQSETAQSDVSSTRTVEMQDTNAQVIQPMMTMVSAATRDMQGLTEGARAQQNRSSAPQRPREQADSTDVPARSGKGRRVVFDATAQRVWLVRADNSVVRTYRVSGSRHDNLSPGRYEVYSTSRHATSYTLDETMQYMVRFTRGENAAIGFHDIPVDHEGEPVQTAKQLGKQLSSGCIRQRHRDAKALWDFAPEGTRVVVVA